MAFIESGKSFDKESNHKKMKKRMENMDSIQYPLRIPANIYKKLKVKIANEETNLRAVLLELINKYLEK
jgi:hypothetical protein